MWAWLAIPWIRKLAEFALLIAAIAAVVFAIYHAGEHAGAQGEAGKQTEARRAEFDQLRTNFQQQLANGQAREEQLGQLATKFADLATGAATRVSAARQASASDAARIQSLPDTAVKADLESKVGPLESPAVLRHVDDVVTDYAHKVDEAKASAEEIAAVNARIDAVLGQLSNAQGERDAAIEAFNHLVALYAQAYNAAITGHRKWYCLFVCKPKNKLSLPSPITLGGPVKKGA